MNPFGRELGSVLGALALSATFWTAVGALGSVIALILIYRQIQSAKDVSAYQFLRVETDRFESKGMCMQRSDLARILIRFPGQYGKIDEYAEPICGYFEDLGLMLSEGITPKHFTWTMCYDDVVNYWLLLKDYVRWVQTESGDASYYSEFGKLFDELVRLNKKELKGEDISLPGPGKLREFLDGEMQLGIRPFRLADIANVSEVERCCFDVDAYTVEEFQELYERHSEGFFVAELQRQLVGYIIGYAKDATGEIDSMAVHPQDRGLGIGRSLLEHMLECFKARGITRYSLEVRTDNTAAIRLYEDTGFHIHATLAKYYKDEADAYQMTAPAPSIKPDGGS